MTAGIVCFLAHAALDHLFVFVLSMGTFGLGLSSSVSFWLFLAVQAVILPEGKIRVEILSEIMSVA